jgi:hypothetical protein
MNDRDIGNVTGSEEFAKRLTGVRNLHRAARAGRREAAVRGIRAGYRPRGARHLEFAVRHPRAVRRQAGRAGERRALTTAQLGHHATPKEDA